MIQVRLGQPGMAAPIIFGATDGFGCAWHCEDVEGWSGPDVDITSEPLSAAHGMSLGDALFRGRSLVVRGVVVAPTSDALQAALYRLAAQSSMSSITGPGVLRLYEVTTRECYVVRGGPLRWRIRTDKVAEFEVPLFAPDPRKYNATPSSSAGNGSRSNAGDFETWPVITVTGGVNGSTINNTSYGKTMTLIGAVGGSSLVIDMKARTAKISGGNRYDLVSPGSQWFPLFPGANNITMAGGGSITSVAWQDAWV